MSSDTLDDLGRRAAADLHVRARTIDTGAAFAAFGPAGDGRHRPGWLLRRSGRPVFIGAAAAALVAVLSVGLVVRGHGNDGPQVRTGSVAPVDPATYGPVVATTTGPDGERLELRAPRLLHDGDLVLVVAAGATPGAVLSAVECNPGVEGSFNPMSHCANPTGADDGKVGADGRATHAMRVWSRYDGQGGSRIANRCGTAGCVLQLQLRVGDGGPIVTGADGRPAFALPLTFAPDPDGPSEPTLDVQQTVATPDTRSTPGLRGSVAALRATGLAAGPTTIWLDVHDRERLPGPLRFVQPTRSIRLAEVEVGPNGQAELDLVVPKTVSQAGAGGTDWTCGEDGVTCDIRVGYPERTSLPRDWRWLAPEPVPAP
ncbi:hypothetical protein BH10ACT1_BH10ACT1_36010 [soil metagenome]